ncbi:MAG: PUR family DNA/RNA-binding protein [Massilibacteroides sp.]|nr:PUR family DNA/RNA-binding protein [Massilibacteroides sp.]
MNRGLTDDKEILYSKTIRAGKRIYYIDVKRNLREDLFIALTESKKVIDKETSNVRFEKHKIFLYKEDFDNFMNGMTDVIGYIKKELYVQEEIGEKENEDENPQDKEEEKDFLSLDNYDIKFDV